jgi:long-chain acyl-CoA synthetase
MPLDFELYRRTIRIPSQPPVEISVIDIDPEFRDQTLVFLHGYGGQARQWKYQLAEFSISNRVIAIDLRGHGLSDKPPGDYSMRQILEDLRMVLDELEIKRSFYLIGHSFGGAIATEFAAAHPERIVKLILIATAGEFKLNPFYRFLLKLPKQSLKYINPIVRGWLSAPPLVMHAWYHQNITKWNGWSLFRDLVVPTTVIRGHQDKVFSKSMFDEVARAIPNADEINVGASGHLVMLERREAVNRVIQGSLETHPRTWRQDSVEVKSSNRAILLNARPWLVHYDAGTPYTIAIPKTPVHELLKSASNRFPRQTALIFEGNKITYQQLSEDVSRFVQGLQNLGIKRCDRIILMMPNLPQLVIAYFGILEIGAVAVFSHPITDENELVRQLQVTQARVLVTLERFDNIINKLNHEIESGNLPKLSDIILTEISDYLPAAKKLLVRLKSRRSREGKKLNYPNIATHHFIGFIKNDRKPEFDKIISADSLATIQFTGGTTADPKGVMLSHQNLIANVLQTRHWMPDAEEGKERFLSVLPFSHSYGLTAGLNLPVAIGATIILKIQVDTMDLLKSIQRFRPTVFPGVPSIYMAIKDHPNVRKYGISSIKACISGSAPLPIEIQEAFEKLTRGRLVEGYGLTEAGPVTHANPLFGLRKVGSIGIPLPSTDARIVDLEKGVKEVKVGQIGELAISGPQVMQGYWDDPDASREAINPQGYLLTGDVAQMDADGYFRIISRKADMWYPDKPGDPAFPRDVEEVLFEIPQVKDAAVVAIANRPIAFIITRHDRPKAKEIIAFCTRRLPPKQVPLKVIFVDEFPRTFIGKILRRELADRFAETQLEHQRLTNESSQDPTLSLGAVDIISNSEFD